MGAKGLMQIIPRFHLAKLEARGGEESVLDPESNVAVGARILQEYVYRTGSLEAGLQQYNGASRDESAQYTQKVMAERARLERVLRRTQVTAVYARGG
jgi:soluble lytic murein transglycosylase-like protein